MSRATRAAISVLAAVIVTAACGAGSDDATSPDTAAIATPGLPSTYLGPDGVTSTIDSAARIVTLSGEFSEIVWELGLGDNLVGVDLSSDFPAAEMRVKPKVGVEFRIFAEPILALDPTVVIGDIDAQPPDVIEQVRAAGVPVVILPRLVGVDAPAEKIRLVAEVLGVVAVGEVVATSVQNQIDAALVPVARADSRPRVAVVYIATQDQILLLGSNTVFEGLLEAVGAEDVGPPAGFEGFVPLTAEAIAAAAPDVIITARRGFDDRGGLEGFVQLPGIAQTPAGAAGRVLVYDDSLLLTLGPRTGQILEMIVADLHPELASE
jgi:iron complex transport system substrate-binding protein